MSIFIRFLLLFIPSCYFGVLYLSYFQLKYVHFAPERWLPGLPITMGITTGLLAIIIIAIKIVTNPFDKLFKKIDKEGYVPTDDEKNMALKTYKKTNTVSIIGISIGFILGNMINALIKMFTGALPLEASRVIVVFLQSCIFGLLESLFMVFAMNEQFTTFRKKLHIQSLSDEVKSSKVNHAIMYVALSAMVFVSYNIFAIGYGFVNTYHKDMIGTYMTGGILTLLVSGSLGIMVLFLILKGLSKRIKYSTKILEDLESGKLNSRIDIEILDDFGVLGSAVNKLISTLSNMLSGLRKESSIVSSSAEELTLIAQDAKNSLELMKNSLGKISEEGEKQEKEISNSGENINGLLISLEKVSQNVIQNSDAMKESSACVIEMSENINSVAGITKKADAVSENLSASCEKGGISLREASSQMSAIQESSEKIRDIVKFLSGIANQTNLLAMNAAIEAAHAGAVGQGFAVVAEEVRSLANSSQESAKKISDYIADMVNKVQLGVECIGNTSTSFKDIENAVAKNAQLIQSITTAMEEQQHGAEDNMKTTKNVSDGTSRIRELVVNQNQLANTVGSSMEKAVSSTQLMINAINDGQEASGKMDDVISRINVMVSENKKAVEQMAQQMKTFSL